MTKELVPTKKIDFPPVEAAEKVKLTRFLKTTGEFMEADIEVKEVTMLRVVVDASRSDVATIINKVAANERRKQKEASTRKK